MKLMPALPDPKYTGPILQLSKYTAALSPCPAKVYWEYKVPAGAWEMLGNDTVGDCEIARILHIIMSATAHTGTMLVPTVDEALAVYAAISGYDPSQTQPDGSNPTDVGCNSEDVFNYWQKTGITIGGVVHNIAAWVQIASTADAIKQAIWLFGAASIDIQVFQSMMDQTNAKQPWDNPTGNLLGYHAVPGMGFGSEGLTVITWAALQQMGWPTCLQIMQAAYAVITPEWIAANGKAPNGFDLATLQTDLVAMG
jgi:hypothetical protein